MTRWRLLLISVLFGLLIAIPGCPGAQPPRDDVERSKMDALGLRVQKVRKAMADETMKAPTKAREIAGKYAKALQYLDEEVAKLPEPLQQEFARKYGKK